MELNNVIFNDMNREEIESFVTRNLPIAIKSKRTGKLVYPYRSRQAHEQVINSLTDALVKNNVDLDFVSKPLNPELSELMDEYCKEQGTKEPTKKRF